LEDIVVGTLPDVGRDSSRTREWQALYTFADRVYHATGIGDVYAAALDVITQTLDCERASILLFDSADVMQFVAWRGLSQGYRTALAGHSPWSATDTDPAPIFVADIRTTDESDRVKAEIAREGIVSLGFVPLTVRGRVIGKFMTYYPDHHDFSPHERELAIAIARQLSFAIERQRIEDSRQMALEDLRLSEHRFKTMSENAPVMIWMSDSLGKCEHLNQRLRDFWGVAEEDVATFDWHQTLHPDDGEALVARMIEAVTHARPVNVKARYRSAAGSWHWLETTAHPRYAADGQFIGMIGVNVDVTQREEIERQREVMFAELNHRVKNTLAMVQALARQSLTTRTPEVRGYLSRISAIAKAHNILSRSNWEATPLMQLARNTLAAGTDRPNFDLSGPDILLSPKQTLALAMALHELHTNAMKYGCLVREDGIVRLSWETHGSGADRTLRLVWREEGGDRIAPPTRRGFGSVLVQEVLAADLGGSVSLDYPPEGLVCVVDAPLAPQTAAA
jgi:PAS domain S-box-containing protein